MFAKTAFTPYDKLVYIGGVVKLVYTHASGACGRKSLRVQISPSPQEM